MNCLNKSQLPTGFCNVEHNIVAKMKMKNIFNCLEIHLRVIKTSVNSYREAWNGVRSWTHNEVQC